MGDNVTTITQARRDLDAARRQLALHPNDQVRKLAVEQATTRLRALEMQAKGA